MAYQPKNDCAQRHCCPITTVIRRHQPIPFNEPLRILKRYLKWSNWILIGFVISCKLCDHDKALFIGPALFDGLLGHLPLMRVWYCIVWNNIVIFGKICRYDLASNYCGEGEGQPDQHPKAKFENCHQTNSSLFGWRLLLWLLLVGIWFSQVRREI